MIMRKKYFLDLKGVMVTKLLTVQGNKYYFDSSSAVTAGRGDGRGKRYYFDISGVMQTCWLNENNHNQT